MEYQNITLSIPKDLLRKVKHIAIEKQTSVSGLLSKMLADIVQREDSYVQARSRHLAILASGFDMGTQGRITWHRDDIHAR
ncbi:MAG TPA: CopG family transcriptional regulator [Firmicutes bacterium]|nr:CopG family transcriptional regulator [Bacillota bacterium]